MVTIDKSKLEELWDAMPKPLLIITNQLHVSGQPEGDMCYMRGVYVGPGTDVEYGGSEEGSFYMNDSGDMQLPNSAENLREKLDAVAALQDTAAIVQAIADRNPIFENNEGKVHRGGITESYCGDYGICGFNEQRLYLDPVNEWLVTLVCEIGSWGVEFGGSDELQNALIATLWTEAGVEVLWSQVSEAERTALCRLFLESEVRQTEKFSMLTEFLKGLLWPNFWGELESYQWRHIESMYSSVG